MKKLLVILTAIFIASCSNHSDKVKVGAILPLTGAWGEYGVKMKNGLELWKENNPNSSIELYIEDGQGKPSVSISAATKLINIQNVNACITGVTPVIFGMQPLIQQNNMVMLNIGAIHPNIKKMGNDVFSIVPDASVEAKYMAKYVVDSLYKKTCYIYWKNDESSLEAKNIFTDTFRASGAKIVGESTYNSDDEIHNIIQKIKAARPECVYIPNSGAVIARTIRAAISAGLNDILWLGYASVESTDLLNGIDDWGAIHMIYTAYKYNDPENRSQKTEEFTKLYMQKYGELPLYHSAAAYDAIDMINNAVTAGCVTNLQIRNYIQNQMSFSGVTGNHSIDNKNYTSSELTIKTVLNGEFQPFIKE